MDFYNVIGVSSGASAEEITKAYKATVKKCHPDNFINASREEQEKNTQRLQWLNQEWQRYKSGKKDSTVSPNYNSQASTSYNSYDFTSFKQQFNQAYTDFMNAFTARTDNGRDEFLKVQRKKDSIKATLNERERIVRLDSYSEVENMKQQAGLLNNDIEAFRRVIQDNATAIIQKRNELANLHNRKIYQLMPKRFKSEDNILVSQLEKLEKKAQILQNVLNKKIAQYTELQMKIRNYPEECVNKDPEVIRLRKELSDIEQTIKEFVSTHPKAHAK